MPQPSSRAARISRLVALSSTTSTRSPRSVPTPITACAAGMPACGAGSANQKVMPLPRLALDADLARPSARRGAWRSPAPGRCRRSCRVVEPSACAKASKMRAALAPGCRCRCRATSKRRARRCARSRRCSATADARPRRCGELDGVADQVDQHLPQPDRVAAAPAVGTLVGDVAAPARAPWPAAAWREQHAARRSTSVARGRSRWSPARACRPRSWRSRGCR